MKVLIRHGKCISCDCMPPPASRLQWGTGRSPSSCLPERSQGTARAWGHTGPSRTHEWPFSVTAWVSYGVVTTISFPSPRNLQAGHPPSQDVLKGSFWVSHPSGKMVLWSQMPEQTPECLCPPSMLFPCLLQFSQHHTWKQAARTTLSTRKGKNTQSRQSS